MFGMATIAFLEMAIAWAYFALKAIRAGQWAVALLRGFAAAISFGAVVFEIALVGNMPL